MFLTLGFSAIVLRKPWDITSLHNPPLYDPWDPLGIILTPVAFPKALAPTLGTTCIEIAG